MSLPFRLVLLAIDFMLLSAPPILQPWLGGDLRSYVITTLMLVAVNIAVVWLWPRRTIQHQGHEGRRGGIHAFLDLGALGVLGGWLLVITTSAWLHEILVQPIDPQRADMLVVVQQGIQRALHGQNPYTIYHLPWDAPLPYGPALWLPFAVPFALHADIRFVTIAGMLFVPVACAMAALAESWRSEWLNAAAWLVLLASLSGNPDLQRFAAIGHTPVYWPLLALFVWLAASERWSAAAVTAGVLIVARTTMVAVAPVFLMMVWRDARPRFVQAAGLLAAAVAIPFLPFAVWDFASLRYALYGSYQVVMKGFVWTSTTWAQHTIGITGWLLAAGWQRAVEVTQLVVMLAVYGAAWLAIRAGRSALPWMGVALLAFSMTTLWPVTYIYFDVVLLLICAALVETPWLAAARAGLATATTLAVSIALVIATASFVIPRAGATHYRRLDREEVLVPRLVRSDAVIDIECTSDSPQQFTAVLNGTPLGSARLEPGLQHVSMAASARLWQIGANELQTSFSGDVTRSALGQVTVK